VIPLHGPGLLYLDPATGSIALQVMIGGLLALAAAVRIYWGKLRSVFGWRDRAASGDSPDPTSQCDRRKAP
jgi:hypothetical protein